MKSAQAVAALLREGEEAIRQSLTFAKAVTGEEKEDPSDLDGDFEELDEARSESDEAHEADEDEDEDAEPGKGASEDDDEDEDDDGQEGDDGDDDEEAEAFAKAEYDDVDATPLLEALDARLTEQSEMLSRVLEQNSVLAKAVQGLQAQNATLAKAVQSNAEATLTFAKAHQGAADLPLVPKSRAAQQVKVPTRTPGAPALDANAVMAKAEQAVYSGQMAASQMSLLNTLANTHGIEAALEQFPPAIREMLGAK